MKSPAPRVLAWSSSDKNAVNAEYIIMEKAKGVQLASMWPKMELDQRVQVVRAIARHQRAWLNISFSRIGSLYYAKDSPSSANLDGPLFSDDLGKPITDSKFVIGPILGREWMDNGRATIDSDRGPCECSWVIAGGYLTDEHD